MKKTFVRVLAEMDENGKKTPKVIDFAGKKFEVDRVLDVKKCSSMKVGGVGERYRVRIGGKETYIFFEDNKWFVEEK